MTAMKLLQTGLQWLALAAFSGCVTVAATQAQSLDPAQALEIIELQYRPAQEVIPVLQPLLESGGAISGANYQLFVRTSAANLVQLRQALAAIDRQPRQLLVSVRRVTQQELQREGLGVEGSVSGVIGNGQSGNDQSGNGQAAATVHATDTSALRHGAGVASVQVLEGSSAYIATGQSVPLVTAVVAGGGRSSRVAAAIAYRDLSNGFLVTPRLSGGRSDATAQAMSETMSETWVTLDVAQQAQRSSHSGNIETQQLSTQVSARLGEWMRLGGVNESANSQRNGVLDRQYTTQYTTQDDARSIWVKVEDAR